MAVDPEVEVHEALTEAWVASDPISVVLSRLVKLPTTSGGYTTTLQSLDAQSFRMDRSSQQSLSMVTTPDGTQVPLRFRLVGDPNADVEAGDTFELDGAKYEITFVARETFRRSVAEVEYRG